MRALNSADLKVRGALWNDSVSASDAGAGVADVDAAADPAAPEERDLNAAIVVESVVVVVVGAQELAKCQRRAIANAGVVARDPRKGRPSGSRIIDQFKIQKQNKKTRSASAMHEGRAELNSEAQNMTVLDQPHQDETRLSPQHTMLAHRLAEQPD
jgi:hypothetical protein